MISCRDVDGAYRLVPDLNAVRDRQRPGLTLVSPGRWPRALCWCEEPHISLPRVPLVESGRCRDFWIARPGRAATAAMS
jgi:hypothetical protein